MSWACPPTKRSYSCTADVVRFHRERRGWTQRELAKAAGYSERLVSKAEAGHSISAAAVADLADALSTLESPIYPEDLIVDPVQLAKAYIAAEYQQPGRVVDAIRHFLDEEIVIRLAGDPAQIPFAGEHRGIAEVERAFEIYYSILEVPAGHDHTPWYEFLGQGNEAIVWGKSWIHPIGRPMEKPMDLVHRMKFRRGKLIEVEVVFDSLEGSRVLHGED